MTKPPVRAFSSSDPLIDRQERERVIARAMQRGLAECESTEVLLAATLHTKRSNVAAWRDPHSKKSVPAAHLLGLPPVVRRVVVEVLAESLGCALVELPDAQVTEGGRLAVASSAAKETGEAVSALVARAADETLSESQADALDRELQEAITALATARESVRTRRRRSGARA